jgi:hypothetical protein
MLDRRLSAADAAAIIVTLVLTIGFDWLSGLPRLLVLAVLFQQTSIPAPHMAVLFYLAEAFAFGIVAGTFSITVSRRLLRRSAPAVTAVFAAALALAYAVITVPLFSGMGSILPLFVDRLPGFMPVYLDLCGGLPGWILGYFFGCGALAQAEIGPLMKLAFAILTSFIVAVVFIAPPYVPPDLPLVQDSFHRVPPAPQYGLRLRVLPPPNSP